MHYIICVAESKLLIIWSVFIFLAIHGLRYIEILIYVSSQLILYLRNYILFLFRYNTEIDYWQSENTIHIMQNREDRGLEQFPELDHMTALVSSYINNVFVALHGFLPALFSPSIIRITLSIHVCDLTRLLIISPYMLYIVNYSLEISRSPKNKYEYSYVQHVLHSKNQNILYVYYCIFFRIIH